ncbi:MAG: hypothetical protein GWM90_28705 [Gemmatimonadetes bacterium]|nr:hypothetical protein [Gemmatimonadota bacterium]NIQ59019.1 hypothetical protein [Gemmatimonadota bacterium]NIU79226.1 hypothetical protein [Gammaproteobacteria bacterium]NIX47907.1 hypothetical protein [Gemmatimonadota bacterium]NIY12278.1 hypothetical protein [Gemmatimonadota bacterium]
MVVIRTASADPPEEGAMLAGLVRELRCLTRVEDGLQARALSIAADDVPTDVERGARFTYGAVDGRGSVTIAVSRRRIKLKARWAGGDGTISSLEERMLVSLDGRPRCGEEEFGSVGELATALVGRMRRRLEMLRSGWSDA